ncbi:GTP-binding protein [Pseudomaricurvus sp. HS19]|uniref:CobW family GTP-binding protein n=1 Tax=Pseudomaricurvus sp. HS19 TaxID=2692626 RepID=UPI00136DAE3A|nr:GTP-binding protein [Pseudomaricurvus sp. HS19]MYM62960.1 GTP-binding protein [Pseudomaricurvus sp. HS19]
MKAVLANIPTNIITGFLGAGKTTVIRHLLQSKPVDEKWAVLVNEFGEVGIDGALLQADGIAVKEVPGGCMCCAVGIPSRVALNQLVRQHRPDRILIEPTGLAHPQQILTQFTSDEYASLLRMQTMVCLIDPWSVTQEQINSLPNFRSQVELADALIMTKADEADEAQRAAFEQYCEPWRGQKTHVGAIRNGELPWQWLCEDHQRKTPAVEVQSASHRLRPASAAALNEVTEAAEAPPVTEPLRLENEAEFGSSCGWRLPVDWCFNEDALLAFLRNVPVPRVKGVLRCDGGWFLFNRMRTTVSVEPTAEARESRLEMIHTEAMDWQPLEAQLFACRSDA